MRRCVLACAGVVRACEHVYILMMCVEWQGESDLSCRVAVMAQESCDSTSTENAARVQEGAWARACSRRRVVTRIKRQRWRAHV
ncbi:hypothetical protein DENSPDRAFT_582457 [Dentipellis sp. KUC8613]|nr:hypothetical protein DENSPDRAFT_582457 [Dentipellis sp. KUC8613]